MVSMKALTLAEISAFSEDDAREYLEAIRWPKEPLCAHCQSANVTRLQGKSTRAGVYKCKACRKPFTVTVGTIFHRSHIPLRKWLIGFHLLCASKKGFSALQLQRTLGLKSYKSAWHMAHRIRYAMKQPAMAALLAGTVEVDETYVGGKPRYKNMANKGGGVWKKAAVVALVERDGNARAFPVKRVNSMTLQKAILANVSRNARLMTDEHQAYPAVGKRMAGGHETVNHSAREYARGDAHINTVEGFFALLKRGVYGTFHHVSKPHLGRYCDEFSFRWNHRKISDGARTVVALQQSEGRLLTYRRTVSQR